MDAFGSVQSAVKRVSAELTGLSGFFFLIGLIFLAYYELNLKYTCSCEGVSSISSHCWVFLILPAFMFFCVVLGLNNSFQMAFRFTFRYACRKRRVHGYFVLTVLKLLCRAFFAALVWIVILLMDGDWYICCSNSLPERLSYLACKNKTSLTFKERDILLQLKNKSLDIGLMLLSSSLFVVVLVTAVSHCCSQRCRGGTCCWLCSSNPYRAQFKEHLLEEAETMITIGLQTAAARYGKAKLSRVPVLKVLCKNPTSAPEDQETEPSGETQAAEQEAELRIMNKVEAINFDVIPEFIFKLIDEFPSGGKPLGTVMAQNNLFPQVINDLSAAGPSTTA